MSILHNFALYSGVEFFVSYGVSKFCISSSHCDLLGVADMRYHHECW